MDLVSSAHSLAISIADTVTCLYKLCRDWPDCPRGIHELSDDLERAEMFLYVPRLLLPISFMTSGTFRSQVDALLNQLFFSNLIKSGLESPMKGNLTSIKEEHTTVERIGYLLKKEEKVIARLQALSHLLLIDSSSSSNQTRRLTWLENFPVISRLRRALKHNLACIHTLLLLNNLCVALQIPNSILDKRLICIVPLHRCISPDTLPALEDVHEELMSRSRLVTDAQDTTIIDAAGASRRLVTRVAHSHVKRFHGHQAPAEKFLSNVGQLQSDNHVKYRQNEYIPQLQQMQRPDQTIEEAGDTVCLEPAESLALPFASAHSMDFRMRSICPYECQCACHGTETYGSWSCTWFSMVLGSVLVSCYGMPLWTTACTDGRCRTSRANRLNWFRASYKLPPWLSQTTLFVFFSPRPSAPELLLRVINRLPTMSSTEGFWNLKNVIARNDLKSFKFLISNRLASVHDVHHATGQTALHFAIRRENYEMVKILLHAGADPFQGPLSSSAVTALLNRIHTGSYGIKRVSTLFSVTDIMDTYEYTDLHKIILGIQPLDLSEAMSRSRVLVSQINTPTLAGLTPAHVAAIRGGVAHLATLKQSGSDFSIPTLDKKTALHFACNHNRASSALFILDTEGKRAASQVTSVGMTPLHSIVSSREINDDMWQVADRLLELGADIDAPATCDVPPLIYAANAGSAKAIDFLVSRGANIDARDAEGDTALVEAILTNSPECVQALLQQGANVNTVNKYGRGPLQYVAGAGSEAIVDIFQSLRVFSGTNVDKYALDKDGLDATAIFNKRPNLSVELKEKFKRLLDSIPDNVELDLGYEQDQEYHSCASVSSEDEYFDAK